MQLFQGDCLELMKRIPDSSIDLILCDLPYGVTTCKWDIAIPFEPLWEQYKRIIKDNGAICLFGSEPFASQLRMSNPQEYKYDWYWEKERGTGFARSHKQPMRQIETRRVFYKKQPFYNYQGERLEKPYIRNLPIVKSQSDNCHSNNLTESGDRVYKVFNYTTKHNLLKFTRKTKGSLHPTQKPVELLEYLITTYTKEGDTVLDNCMGSGSTGVACVLTNREFIGIEKSQEYFEMAQERIMKQYNHKILQRGTQNEPT